MLEALLIKALVLETRLIGVTGC